VFGYQIQQLTEKDVDSIRSSLLAQREFVPGCICRSLVFQTACAILMRDSLTETKPPVALGACRSLPFRECDHPLGRAAFFGLQISLFAALQERAGPLGELAGCNASCDGGRNS
jgi:hypothetical protein